MIIKICEECALDFKASPSDVGRFWEHDINKSVSKCVDRVKEIT